MTALKNYMFDRDTQTNMRFGTNRRESVPLRRKYLAEPTYRSSDTQVSQFLYKSRLLPYAIGTVLQCQQTSR